MTTASVAETTSGVRSKTSIDVRRLELRRELWRRECRANLTPWCIEALSPVGQTPARHHRLLISELEAVARGETDRLIVTMPPNSAKTTYASVLFPSWFMAQAPAQHIIGASHGSKYAEDLSGQVMRHIRANTETLGYGLGNEA